MKITKKQIQKFVESIIKEQQLDISTRVENLEAMRKAIVRYHAHAETLFELPTFQRQFERGLREIEEAVSNQIFALQHPYTDKD